MSRAQPTNTSFRGHGWSNIRETFPRSRPIFSCVECKQRKMAEKLLGGSHQVKIGNYLLGDTLGSGTFGKVKGKF